MQEQLAREARLQPAALEFYAVAVPAVPLLLLGLLCQEGTEVVRPPLTPPQSHCNITYIAG